MGAPVCDRAIENGTQAALANSSNTVLRIALIRSSMASCLHCWRRGTGTK
jgi:hypothetical protein